MANTIPEHKALVLQAFDTLFNKRDYEAAARFWSDTYIQHSDHIAPGREGLFDLIRSAPDTLMPGPSSFVAESSWPLERIIPWNRSRPFEEFMQRSPA